MGNGKNNGNGTEFGAGTGTGTSNGSGDANGDGDGNSVPPPLLRLQCVQPVAACLFAGLQEFVTGRIGCLRAKGGLRCATCQW